MRPLELVGSYSSSEVMEKFTGPRVECTKLLWERADSLTGAPETHGSWTYWPPGPPEASSSTSQWSMCSAWSWSWSGVTIWGPPSWYLSLSGWMSLSGLISQSIIIFCLQSRWVGKVVILVLRQQHFMVNLIGCETLLMFWLLLYCKPKGMRISNSWGGHIQLPMAENRWSEPDPGLLQSLTLTLVNGGGKGNANWKLSSSPVKRVAAWIRNELEEWNEGSFSSASQFADQ